MIITETVNEIYLTEEWITKSGERGGTIYNSVPIEKVIEFLKK